MEDKPVKKKRVVTKRFFAYLFCAVMLYAGIALFQIYREAYKLGQQKQTLEEQLAQKTLEVEKLKNLIEIAGTDAYIESIAREKLGWVKPGEVRYVIKDQ